MLRVDAAVFVTLVFSAIDAADAAAAALDIESSDALYA